MLVQKGGKIKNWGGECRKFKKIKLGGGGVGSGGGGVGLVGGQGGCE